MKNKKKNPMGMWWPRMREKTIPSKKVYNRKDNKQNEFYRNCLERGFTDFYALKLTEGYFKFKETEFED